MGRIGDFLRGCGAFEVLTIQEGFPTGRPFGAVMEDQGRLYISTHTGKAVYRQLKQESRMGIVALKPNTREWIRIQGRARECMNMDKKRRMLEEWPGLSEHFSSTECAGFALFEVEVLKAQLYGPDGMEDIIGEERDDQFILSEFSEQDARAVCGWRYEAPYDLYNLPEWAIVQREKWGMADREKRQREFCALRKGGELAGYFRLMERPGGVEIGLGLSPEFCGKGYGAWLMALILREANARYPGKAAYLRVRTFNERAIKCYQRAGFEIKERVWQRTNEGADEFLLMERNNL